MKLVTTKFKSGGLHEKHEIRFYNLKYSSEKEHSMRQESLFQFYENPLI